MRKALNWLLNTLWVILLVPAITAWLKAKGWESWALGIADYIYEHLIGLLGVAAFPWVAGTLLGVSLGVFLHKLQIKYLDIRHAKKRTFQKLEKQASSILRKTHMTLGSFRAKINLDRDGIPAGLVGEIDRLFADLSKLKIETPSHEGLAPSEALEFSHHYIDYIRHFFEDMDVNVLRSRASQWLAQKHPAA